jgi:hypothetical protein
MGRSRLIWKLLGIIACAIAFLMVLVWLAVDYLAAYTVDARAKGYRHPTIARTEG